MIKEGKAYVDNQSAELMAEQKGAPSAPRGVVALSKSIGRKKLDLFQRIWRMESIEAAEVIVLRAKNRIGFSKHAHACPILYPK